MNTCINENNRNSNRFLAFFDDESKGNVTWWNRNYFYAGTILVVLINILIFAFVKEKPWDIVGVNNYGAHWGDVFYFDTTICGFLSCFFHSNWQHVLLNMLCFFIAGLYLERKKGTLGLILFVIFTAYITAVAIQGNDLSVYSVGFSGANYFIYATIITDYIFSFQKHKKNKINIVLGGIELALIYLAMCFKGGTTSVSFAVYPYDLMHNMAHYTSFLAGIIVSLFVEITRFLTRKSILDTLDQKGEPKAD